MGPIVNTGSEWLSSEVVLNRDTTCGFSTVLHGVWVVSQHITGPSQYAWKYVDVQINIINVQMVM